MAPGHQQGQAADKRCYCPNPDCARSNFDYNTYCHFCSWVMPKKLLLFKPSSAAPKGGGKGKHKGKGKGGKGNDGSGGKGGGRTANENLCSCCGVKGHAKADCRQPDKVCNNCGKTGHIAAVCRSRPPGDSPQTPQIDEDAFIAA